LRRIGAFDKKTLEALDNENDGQSENGIYEWNI